MSLRRAGAADLANAGLVPALSARRRGMMVFVWTHVDKVSYNYHERGGLVVFAHSEERARQLANAEDGVELPASKLPADVRVCADGPEQVYVFPDAGCC